MTTQQIKLVRVLLAQAGLTEYKSELVCSHTDGRTDSLTAMTYAESLPLIKYLKQHAGQPDSPAERMQRKILSLAHEMKWHQPGTRKVDVARVNRWLTGKGGFDTTLNQLNYADLPKAVTAFEQVYKSYLKGI